MLYIRSLVSAFGVLLFFPVVRRAFFEKPEGLEGKGEASPLMVVPLTVTAILSVLLGLFPNLFFKFFDMAVQVSQSLIRAGGV